MGMHRGFAAGELLALWRVLLLGHGDPRDAAVSSSQRSAPGFVAPGRGALVSAIEPAPGWDAAVARSLAADCRRVLVLGATDVGKSQFCRFLLEALRLGGRRAALVDADPGQKTIGPPAAVTLGDPTASAAPRGIHFVGSTSPAGHFLPLVVGTAALAAAAPVDVTVIDTDGMMSPAAVVLRTAMIDAVEPDLLVAIERHGELAAILAAAPRPTIRLEASPLARRKSPARRAAARRRAFADYFRAAAPLRLSLAELPIVPTTPAAARLGLAAGRLCGTLDAAGRGTGLALVEGCDATDGHLDLLTPVPRDSIRGLRTGELFVTRDGEERRAGR
jgi:polynucleotide 5'-hydroxyl-kinase GRC3/NOL9